MKCLVVGASSYIAKAFIKKYETQCSITALTRNDRLHSYFDLTDEQFQGFDLLINFTAIVHQKKPDLESSHTINTELAIFLAKKAKKAGITHFIQMSTIAVYSPSSTHINESTQTLPTTVYGQTKLKADVQLSAMRSSTFKIAIIRPPVVYGPDAPGNMHALISLIQKGIPLPFLYTKNHRAILYIDNLTNALFQIMLLQADGIFILRDELSPSLATLSTTINQHLQKECKLFTPPTLLIKFLIRFKKLPFFKLYGDLELDDSFAYQKIGRYSTISLNEALEKTIKG